ncbi:MAG: PD-(D/E)XK nuclease family protein [Candidatus Latescibacterota bacterium]|nr:PD-(D/E)XK nuclease family protein [Candidatus Latescibacterota bacterium]
MTETSTRDALVLSQSGLDAYHRCCRRYHLSYMQQLQWPAPLTDSELKFERSLRRGQDFHRLVHQHQLGLDVERLVSRSADPVLVSWWQRYLQFGPQGMPAGTVHSELEISAALGPHQLVAKFDRLVLGDDGSLVIVDWKTGNHRVPIEQLRNTWQTVVYCYVATEASSGLVGGVAVPPEQVRLIYWHAVDPSDPDVFDYSTAQHEAGCDRLTAALEKLHSLPREAEAYPRTDDQRECRHCIYRSYCDRPRDPVPYSEAHDEIGDDDVDTAVCEIPEADGMP